MTVEPLTLPSSLAPTNSDAAPPAWGQFCMVPVSALGVDRTYQRAVQKRGLSLIRQIAEAFDPDAFGVLLGYWDGERFALIDGQHRALAAQLLGLRMVPCLETSGDAAQIFGRVNQKRTNLTPVQVYRAAVAAGDDDACALQRIANDLELRVKHPAGEALWQPGDLTSPARALGILREHGEHVAEETLRVLAQAERDTQQPYVRAGLLRAVADLIADWFADQGRASTIAADCDALVCTVTLNDVDTWELRAHTYGAIGVPKWRRLAMALADIHETASRRLEAAE